MTNPFPGMDPFLEEPTYWRDFHQSFLTYWRDWLLDHLPEHYEVRLDERVSLVEDPPESGRNMLPDILVSQTHPLPLDQPSTEVAVALELEPATMELDYLAEETESFLRVFYRPDASLITVLELLSPTNKVDAGRQAYLRKRNEYLRETVHLVELDLLRGGKRLPTRPPLQQGDYFAVVSRGEQRPSCEVYAWTLRQPLPRIRIPLKPPDPDVIFDLPGLFAQAYQRGRYARDLPHDKAPPVAFSADDQAWVTERLKVGKSA